MRASQGIRAASPLKAALRRAPSPWALAGQVRDMNRDCDGPATVCLVIREKSWPPALALLPVDPGEVWAGPFGSEEIPGDNRPLDAMAVARRLLAAHADGQEDATAREDL